MRYDPTTVAVWLGVIAFLAAFWGGIVALVAYVVR
jgi:hypothetical protein